MKYVKSLLCLLSAVTLAELVPGVNGALKGISEQKATGIGAVAGSFLDSLFSPLFWFLIIVLSASFFAVSHLRNRALRVVLFWTPTLFLSAIGVMIFSFFAYIYIRH